MRGGPFPYYGATGQVGWIDAYRQDGEYILLGEDGAPFLDPSKPKAYLVSGKCWVNNHAHVLRGRADICSNRYLLHALNHADYRGFANGTTRLKLTQAAMRQIPLRIAPYEEQLRIADRVDELLSDITASVAALSSAKFKLKRYRAALLRAAVEGKLTADWRKTYPNVEPADKLLERILVERRRRWDEAEHAKFVSKGKTPPANLHKRYECPPISSAESNLPGWRTATLEQLSSAARPICYGILMPKENLPDGVPYVRVKDMRGDTLDVHGLHRTSPKIAANYARATLRGGDLLLAIRGTYGRVVEVPPILEGGNITQDTARVEISPLMSARFVGYALRSDHCQRYFDRVARGVAVKGVNIADVRLTPIPVPPLVEQEQIVFEIERRLSDIDHVAREIANSARRIAQLLRAILKRAFDGKLVPQDRDAEPASVLLERIRANRAQAAPAQQTRGRRMQGERAAPRRPGQIADPPG
jgi:type I restriction enzyme S subunit